LIVEVEDVLEREQRERVGLVGSFAVHVLLVLVIVLLLPHPISTRDQTAEQVITITRRPLTIAKRPKPNPTPIPHVPEARAVAAAPAPKAAAAAHVPVVHRVVQAAPRRVVFVPHKNAPPLVRNERPGTLSGANIAQINSDLGAAIAADRAGRDVLAGTSTQVDYSKHYASDAGSFVTGVRHAHGLCDPIKSWEADGYNYYFVSCNVHMSDGTFERQPVPWPVRFKPNHDPFAGTYQGEEPLALPLPGWTLPSGETISKELRQYALDQGVQLPE